jgi:hypothetical protein
MISAASNNSSGTAVMSLSGAVEVDPIEAQAYADQLAATGRRYDSKPEDVLDYISPPLNNGSTASGALIENNEAYEDFDA